MTCPHGICYGLKWLFRQEGPRDHVNMLKSLAVLPNIIVCDIANMIVAHGRKGVLMFLVQTKVVLLRLQEKTLRRLQAANCMLTGLGIQMVAMDKLLKSFNVVLMSSCCITPSHNLANTSVYLIHFMRKILLTSLFDPFHEKNTVNPADSLRRVSCVRQLGGKMKLEIAEQLNNRRNRDNYFTTSLTPHNAVFIERLVAHFTNQKLNNKIYDTRTRQVYRHAIQYCRLLVHVF